MQNNLINRNNLQIENLSEFNPQIQGTNHFFPKTFSTSEIWESPFSQQMEIWGNDFTIQSAGANPL
jgi:hypothetical protein